MAQNVYADPAVFAGYSPIPRSRDGRGGTPEGPAFCAMPPAIAGKRVLDAGCGFGQLSRWLAEAGAATVLGIDLSQRMLAEAGARAPDSRVTFRCADLDTLELARSFELVVSSLALHYAGDFYRISRTILSALTPGRDFVFSVEDPISSARAAPAWVTAAVGRRAFAITDATLNTLRGVGFELTAVNEWQLSKDQLAAHPEWRETELARPMLMSVSAHRPQVRGH